MPRYPSLCHIYATVWLNQLSEKAGKHVTLADIDDATLHGFNGTRLRLDLATQHPQMALSRVSRGSPQLRAEFETLLPHLIENGVLNCQHRHPVEYIGGIVMLLFSIGDTAVKPRGRPSSFPQNQ